MTPTWVDLPGLFPLDRNASHNSSAALRGGNQGNRQDSVVLQRGHPADVLLVTLVVLFLVSSYIVCRCCRCRWLHHRRARNLSKTPGTRSYAYTLYQSNASGSVGGGTRVVMESVTAPATASTEGGSRPVTKPRAKTKSVLVSEMEEPFLGPPDYAQPPPYEMSPPAYEYLPSAPPLSDDSNHSPRQV